jgi:glycosyltransferase involved in cell wall biosynthesis
MNKKENPKITVYIVSHNYGKFLAKSIDSVINQTFLDWELIIIDDCSSDNTVDVAGKYINKKTTKITLLQNKKNKGLQKIANEVARKANGYYILRLDADDYLHPDALDKLYMKAESNPDASLIYSNFYYVDEIGNIIGQETSFNRVSDGEASDLVAPHGACSLIPLSLLHAVGGYNENINAQDGWDIWYKLNKMGKCLKIEDPLFYYRQHSTSLSKDHSRLINARNQIIDSNLRFKNDNTRPNCYCVLPIKEKFPTLSKNSDMNGLEIVLLTIRQALTVDYVDMVVIPTESINIKQDIIKNLSDDELMRILFIIRDKSNSSFKTFPIVEIINKVKTKLESKNVLLPNYWLYLGVMSKFREVEHINRAMYLIDSLNYDSLVSVVEERSPVFQMGKGSLEILNPGRFNNLEYHDEKIMRYNESLILLRDKSIHANNFLSKKVGYLEMTQAESMKWS